MFNHLVFIKQNATTKVNPGKYPHGITLLYMLICALCNKQQLWKYWLGVAYFDIIYIMCVISGRHASVKPVCNDYLYNKINYLWIIQ